jgi:apolipoprotein D and lipocalin family protein
MTLRLTLCAFLASTQLLFSAMTFTNEPIPVVDYDAYAGKWYSLTSIPTFLDKNWLESIENYTRTKSGYDVVTTYRKEGETKTREIKSKLFTPKEGPQGAIKAQFWWPIKVDYTIIALTKDYSVVGHPKKDFLFIMSRTPSLPQETLDAIIARCKELGYDTDKLKSQQHRP